MFAFLSEYEGFGLTPLEALAAGVPIVVLDTPVAREVYGPAATYVPPAATSTDTATLLGAALGGSAGTGAYASGSAHAVLQRYSWDDAAMRTLAGIERTVQRPWR